MKYLTSHWVFALALTFIVLPAHAYWNHQDLAAEIQQSDSVVDAVDLVVDTLQHLGYEIPLIVDHAAAAESVGLVLRPTQVVFARPPKYIEHALLNRSPTVGIDLPVKILIFEDEDGSIQSRDNPSGYLADRHGIRLRDWLLRKLDRDTGQFVERESGLVTVPSALSVEEAALALLETIKALDGFRLPLVLDFGEGTYRNKSVLVVFGNPEVGTPLMQTTQEVALDLPQKFLVWEDRNGEVQIIYSDPFFIAKRHDVQGQDARLKNISEALARIAATASGE